MAARATASCFSATLSAVKLAFIDLSLRLVHMIVQPTAGYVAKSGDWRGGPHRLLDDR